MEHAWSWSAAACRAVQRPPIPRQCPVRAWLFFTFYLPTYIQTLEEFAENGDPIVEATAELHRRPAHQRRGAATGAHGESRGYHPTISLRKAVTLASSEQTLADLDVGRWPREASLLRACSARSPPITPGTWQSRVAAPIGTARQQVSHTEAGPYVNAAMLLGRKNGQEHVNFGKVEPRDDERGWSGRFLGTVVG